MPCFTLYKKEIFRLLLKKSFIVRYVTFYSFIIILNEIKNNMSLHTKICKIFQPMRCIEFTFSILILALLDNIYVSRLSLFSRGGSLSQGNSLQRGTSLSQENSLQRGTFLTANNVKGSYLSPGNSLPRGTALIPGNNVPARTTLPRITKCPSGIFIFIFSILLNFYFTPKFA